MRRQPAATIERALREAGSRQRRGDAFHRLEDATAVGGVDAGASVPLDCGESLSLEDPICWKESPRRRSLLGRPDRRRAEEQRECVLRRVGEQPVLEDREVRRRTGQPAEQRRPERFPREGSADPHVAAVVDDERCSAARIGSKPALQDRRLSTPIEAFQALLEDPPGGGHGAAGQRDPLARPGGRGPGKGPDGRKGAHGIARVTAWPRAGRVEPHDIAVTGSFVVGVASRGGDERCR